MSGDESTSVDGDDEATVQDLPVPTYDRAPATIQEQASPFRQIAPPRISSRSPTAPGMGGPMVPPVILGAPDLGGGSGSLGLPPDGPTVPDGVLIPPGSWDGPTSPDAGVSSMETTSSWEGATDPDPPRMRPPDPDPNEAKVEISPSMEMDAIRMDDVRQQLAAAPVVPAARRIRNQQPTQQLLPALERKKKDSEEAGSDLPMILGLLALGLFILALIAGGVFYAVRVMQTPDASPAAVEAPSSAE